MAKTFREWSVDQAWLLPPSVQELVPEGHVAHFVRETVREALDLTAIVDRYIEERGYPPYDPVMMTALLLYAYTQGVYSSRRIARACEQRVDFMAVTAMQRPDFRTVSDFRHRHLEALKGLFHQVLRLCKKARLAKLGHVSLDGTKVRANASKHKAMSYKFMKQREPELEAAIRTGLDEVGLDKIIRREVRAMLERAEAEDAQEDKLYGPDVRGDELPEHLRTKQKRLEAIRKAKAELEAEARKEAEDAGKKPEEATVPDKKQRNFTDPESGIMKSGDGFIQAYNAQAAVDAGSQVIVACEVSASPSDVGRLVPMVAQIEKNVGRKPDEMSADAGYASEGNLNHLEEKGIEGFIPTERQKHTVLQPPSPVGRMPADMTRRERMARKLKTQHGRTRYALRKVTVEPVFGQIKQARGFRQFLLRGLKKVQGEFSLLCTAHNLLKLFGAEAHATT